LLLPLKPGRTERPAPAQFSVLADRYTVAPGHRTQTFLSSVSQDFEHRTLLRGYYQGSPGGIESDVHVVQTRIRIQAQCSPIRPVLLYGSVGIAYEHISGTIDGQPNRTG